MRTNKSPAALAGADRAMNHQASVGSDFIAQSAQQQTPFSFRSIGWHRRASSSSENAGDPPMSARDWLFDEFASAAAAAGTREDAVLRSLGVSGDWLWSGPARYGVARISLMPSGLYEPSEEGERAAILPAVPLESGNEDVGDLIAFRPHDPGHWWVRAGNCPILNPDALLRAELLREPLVLHATPLGWLRAGGVGAVILTRCDLRLHLGNIL